MTCQLDPITLDTVLARLREAGGCDRAVALVEELRGARRHHFPTISRRGGHPDGLRRAGPPPPEGRDVTQLALLDLGAPAGWERIDAPGPLDRKIGARWRHPSGWTLEHCGHPTANYPWAMYDPEGRPVAMGAALTPPDPHVRFAWRALREAFAFVGEVLSGARPWPPDPSFWARGTAPSGDAP